jgi:hypothetical protein
MLGAVAPTPRRRGSGSSCDAQLSHHTANNNVEQHGGHLILVIDMR